MIQPAFFFEQIIIRHQRKKSPKKSQQCRQERIIGSPQSTEVRLAAYIDNYKRLFSLLTAYLYLFDTMKYIYSKYY